MHLKSIVVVAAFIVNGGVLPLPTLQRQQPRGDRALDVREVLVAARGASPALCALASDGVSNGGWGGDAPATMVQSDIRIALRNLRSVEIDDDQGRALLD